MNENIKCYFKSLALVSLFLVFVFGTNAQTHSLAFDDIEVIHCTGDVFYYVIDKEIQIFPKVDGNICEPWKNKFSLSTGIDMWGGYRIGSEHAGEWLVFDLTSEPWKMTLTSIAPDCGPVTPYIDVKNTNSTIKMTPGSPSSSIEFVPSVKNLDATCNIIMSIDDEEHFVIDGYSVRIKEEVSELNVFTANVTFHSDCDGVEDVVIPIKGDVSVWPKSYSLKKSCDGGNTWSDYELSTDENGDISLVLNSSESCIYENISTIECRNFILSTSAQDYSNCKFVNKGSIIASETIYYGKENALIGGNEAVYFDCQGVFIAKNFQTNYRNATSAIKGAFRIENSFEVIKAQGQDLEISQCADIKAKKAKIDFSGGTMKLNLYGHMNVEELIVINMIFVYSGAMLTTGETFIDSKLQIVSYPESIVNLCYNPTTGPDLLGFCSGVVLYNYGDYGWATKDPEEEGDLNNLSFEKYSTAASYLHVSEIKAQKKIKAYSTYEDCIAEKDLSKLLGYDDDPFLPKDKELNRLYNCNPCSKDYEDTKIQFRETNKQVYRIINGKLIYCENDN
ncbi:MAG: hypothetical protein MJ197_05865 [Bacteroidales bacterium]|nr:hypothetical protein [Bacteroidales bacterium]